VSTSLGTGQATAAAGDGFDYLIHAPVRLRICAALDAVREIEFAALLTVLDISKSALSKHLTALADAGYVTQRRAVRDTRQRVWLGLTPTGRSAYRGHVAALHQIVGNAHAHNPPHQPARDRPGR
jgi:DNA-binding MarR family transcriptional regulator